MAWKIRKASDPNLPALAVLEQGGQRGGRNRQNVARNYLSIIRVFIRRYSLGKIISTNKRGKLKKILIARVEPALPGLPAPSRTGQNHPNHDHTIIYLCSTVHYRGSREATIIFSVYPSEKRIPEHRIPKKNQMRSHPFPLSSPSPSSSSSSSSSLCLLVPFRPMHRGTEKGFARAYHFSRKRLQRRRSLFFANLFRPIIAAQSRSS